MEPSGSQRALETAEMTALAEARKARVGRPRSANIRARSGLERRKRRKGRPDRLPRAGREGGSARAAVVGEIAERVKERDALAV